MTDDQSASQTGRRERIQEEAYEFPTTIITVPSTNMPLDAKHHQRLDRHTLDALLAGGFCDRRYIPPAVSPRDVAVAALLLPSLLAKA